MPKLEHRAVVDPERVFAHKIERKSPFRIKRTHTKHTCCLVWLGIGTLTKTKYGVDYFALLIIGCHDFMFLKNGTTCLAKKSTVQIPDGWKQHPWTTSTVV